MLSRCFLDLSVDVGAFVIGLGQISTFFLFTVRVHIVPLVIDNEATHSSGPWLLKIQEYSISCHNIFNR